MLQELGDAIFGSASPRDAVNIERLRDREAHRQPWIERRVWILEYHLDLAPHSAHFVGGQARDILAIESDPAAVDVDQPQQRASGGRLAATGFADQRQRFAGAKIEAHLLDGMYPPPHASEQSGPNRKPRLQAANLEQRLSGFAGWMRFVRGAAGGAGAGLG